jgi:hypothetical protein
MIAGSLAVRLLSEVFFEALFVSVPGVNEMFSIKTGAAVEDLLVLLCWSAAGADTFFTVLQLAPRAEIPAKSMRSLMGFVFNRNIGRGKIAKTTPKSKTIN